MKIFKILCFIVLLSSCGPTILYDYEKTTDFSKYQTYNYFDDMTTGLSTFDTRRIIRAIDTKLQRIGYQRLDNADFYIDIQSQKFINSNTSNVGIAVGGTGSNLGGGVSVGVPVNSDQYSREISIEFVDIKKNLVFWQAISDISDRPNISPEEREAQFNALMEKIFSKYPPEQDK